MPSTDPCPGDIGLLTPLTAGTCVAAATGDAALLDAMVRAEVALVRAQSDVGLAPAGAADALLAAADDLDLGSIALRARASGNPVVPLAADLAARTGGGAHVHCGATSQDILDTALMLVAAEALDLTLTDLERTAAELARLAERYRDTPMAGRTLTQHAVPTTFGLKAAGWRSLVLAAHRRLTAVRATLPTQLGGAAGTLAAFQAQAEAAGAPRDPDVALRLLAAFASRTGLAEPLLPWHTLRTPVADLAGVLAFTAGALGKIAADVLTLSRTEIGELSEGDGGGSSAMPHKANPVRATLVAAAARQVPALAAVLFAAVAAEDERPAGAWHAEWQPLRESLRLVGAAARAAAELVAGLQVHPHRMADNLHHTGGLIVSEHLAVALAPIVGRTEARQALARAAGRAVEEALDLDEALDSEPSVAGLLPESRLRELTDPANYLGAAAVLVDRALKEHL
ncbi:3-carboxy-cis,cis-muconate cycloisomerase [Streptomyces sp. CB03911]|uniref:3-carboxy-cis,cis-muconate cycloisomerase n=1 Tax=Streptomyces sp. CB03911 TaxID=1804758 RepID=UPI00093DF383|nr:3-carboxy-cis,cis-muconate cycloisomerase [Streptomyces sp. CB03911]OKI25590.1 3-carboxy-cis,cis-muconate cycloisomerase [Streptomyces sp. CB03911]